MLVCFTAIAFAQSKSKSSGLPTYPSQVARPKLVVGLVIDQMRWDYLYRFYSRYGNGGFRRLINSGFSVENTLIPYVPSYTAVGHSTVYTGSVPAISGIIGNDWYDPQLKRDVYCTEDKSVKTVGAEGTAGEMSPKNLLATTVTDELRIATNFKGKVIGVSAKDRGSILPAGHAANAAYWYDGKSGNWITSTHYMDKLPTWVEDLNKAKVQDKFYAKDWNTLYPIGSYANSTADDKAYEGKSSTFPHELKQNIGKNYGAIISTPYGNTLVLDMAKSALKAESLGKDNITDFLAVSCSSTDYVGHGYGPNSIEIEDTYLRLDKDIEDFFTYLDNEVGKGNYLFFLTADHAVAHVPAFMAENKLPGGIVKTRNFSKGVDSLLQEDFGIKNGLTKIMNNQVIFNHDEIAKSKKNFDDVKAATIAYLIKQPGITNAVDLAKASSATIPEEIKKKIIYGYNARRSGDVYFIADPNWFDGSSTGTTHGSWNPYDAHIPLLFMGWNIKPGKTNRTYHMTDIAPTVAALLHIQMPSGNIGEVITEITDK